jgi:hypothetical protein
MSEDTKFCGDQQHKFVELAHTLLETMLENEMHPYNVLAILAFALAMLAKADWREWNNDEPESNNDKSGPDLEGYITEVNRIIRTMAPAFIEDPDAPEGVTAIKRQ